MINGIDVSDYQGQIDWPTVEKAGIAFAVAHFTEGTDYTDPTFPANWAGMKAAGLVRGAYHYAYPQRNQAEAEADWFATNIGPLLEPGDFVALDLEEGTGDLSGWALPFLQRVESRLGFKPMLYSGPYFLAAHNCTNNATIGQYGLWLADWGVQAPDMPAGWSVWAIWQSSAQGRVAGIQGAVDLDVFNGTVDQLKLYGLPAKPAPPVPTNDDYEQLHRLVDAQPFDAGALVSYAQRFV